MPPESSKPAGEQEPRRGGGADTPSAPPGTGSPSPWQAKMRRLYHRAGLPLKVAPDDRLGWLHVAIRAEADPEVRRLVDSGVDLNVRHEEADETCLELAIRKGGLALVAGGRDNVLSRRRSRKRPQSASVGGTTDARPPASCRFATGTTRCPGHPRSRKQLRTAC